MAIKKKSNWDKRPSLHPERKGMLNTSPKKNWVEKAGGLPTYINSVATALMRDKGWSKERAIKTAVNWAKKVCATGRTMGGRVEVSAAVRAAACAATASWEGKKARSRVSLTTSEDKLSDAEFYALFDLDWNAWDSDDEDESLYDLCDSLHTDPSIDLTRETEMGDVLQLPLSTSGNERVGRKLWKKQILPIGKSIQYKGQRLDFTDELASQLVDSFNAGAFETVPLVLADADNRHTEDPEKMRGQVVGLEKTHEGLEALIETDERGADLLQHNPQMGVSPRLFTNFVRGSDGEEFGATLRHVSLTLDPAVYGMKAWESVELSSAADVEVVDLTQQTYVDLDEGGAVMEDQKQEAPVVEEDAKSDVVDLTALQSRIEKLEAEKSQAIDLASKAYQTLTRREVESRLEKLQLGEKAVPKSIIDLARPLVMKTGETSIIDLTAEDGSAVKSSVSEEVFKLLEEFRSIPMGEEGHVDLTAETDKSEEDAVLEALRAQFGS